MKVFDIIKMPEPLKKETVQWLNDLNRTATEHTVCKHEAKGGSELDKYLIAEGAKNEEEVMLFMDW
jgi:hypothetical protein